MVTLLTKFFGAEMRLMKCLVLVLGLAVCGCEAAKPPVQETAPVKKSNKAAAKEMSAVPAEAP